MSNASVPVVHEVEILDEMGRRKMTHIPGERPLTIYLDKREIVTLMTLGSAPEALVLGYLRNQRMVESPDDIESIQVDWETDSAAVKTRRSTVDIDELININCTASCFYCRRICLPVHLNTLDVVRGLNHALITQITENERFRGTP